MLKSSNEFINNNLKSFFLEYNSTTKHVNTSGDKNLSVDGTGILPSVNAENAAKILSFIKTLFSKEVQKINMLDIGAGVGHLQHKADKDTFFNSYSFEGCSALIPNFVCDRNRIAICDLSKKINDTRLNKAFDITTSFEVLEHVHISDQTIFWNNVEEISDRHLCSIHCGNGASAEHCTIMSPKKWEAFFNSRNYTFIKLGDFPVRTENDIFRDFTGLRNWQFSAIYLIEFNNE